MVNIENKVMEEIKSGKVKLRSKYVFLAEKLGVGSAFAFSIILSILFFSLVLFYLRSSDNLFYLSFGSRGLLAFLDSFPYGLIIVFVVFLFVAGFILKKTGVAYKKPFGILAVLLIVSVTLVGAMLTLTRLTERIEQRTFDTRSRNRILRPLMERGIVERKGGIAGRIIEIDRGYFVVQTPQGARKIILVNLERPIDGVAEINSWVMAVGEKQGEDFVAKLIRVINQGDMPMIERGVERRFGPPPIVPPDIDNVPQIMP